MAAEYLVVDTETTGLDYNRHGLITFSGLLVEDGKVTQKANYYNLDWRLNVVDMGAMNVNKFQLAGDNSSLLKNYEALDLKLFAYSIHDWLASISTKQVAYLLGMNVNFDTNFIRKLFHDHKLEAPYSFPFRVIDPICIANALRDCGHPKFKELKRVNSVELYDLYKIEHKDIHTSQKDVLLAHELWLKMRKDLRVK